MRSPTLLTEWITIRGGSPTSVVEAPTQWLDLEPCHDVAVFVEPAPQPRKRTRNKKPIHRIQR